MYFPLHLLYYRNFPRIIRTPTFALKMLKYPYLSPVKTRGYRVELVRLSVRPSVCLSVCPSDIGYFVHASLVWSNWARPFKILFSYDPRSEVVPRQGLISIGWKLSILEHFENCRVKHFHPMLSTLCTRVWYEGIESEISNLIHI